MRVTFSYGSVHKPNSKSTPFGAARYRTFSLRGDWYWFRASDDWYYEDSSSPPTSNFSWE